VPTLLDGAAGDDKLKGGGGPNTILGGDGSDLIVGGSQRDLLVGGTGADRMVGNPEDDILIAGVTAYERLLDYADFAQFSARNTSLERILAEWIATERTATERRANLLGDETSSSFNDRANENDFLNTGEEDGVGAATVFDDGARDVMTGSSGVDWFFANLETEKGGTLDKITDLHDDEFADDLAFILE
jgi:Ca2+-binding RTX toxin-like protein